MTLQNFLPVVSQWLGLLPLWCVVFGGCIAALAFWKDCRRPALLTLLGLLIFGVGTALGPLASRWLALTRSAQGWTLREYGTRTLEVTILINVVRASGLVLLLTAVFLGRRRDLVPPPLPTFPPSSIDPRIL